MSPNANLYDEIGGFGRHLGRRRVLAGQGMLKPRRSFRWRGVLSSARTTQLHPEHEVAKSEFAHLLMPAMEGDDTLAVQRFVDRTGRTSTSQGREPWRLGRPAA